MSERMALTLVRTGLALALLALVLAAGSAVAGGPSGCMESARNTPPLAPGEYFLTTCPVRDGAVLVGAGFAPGELLDVALESDPGAVVEVRAGLSRADRRGRVELVIALPADPGRILVVGDAGAYAIASTTAGPPGPRG